LEHSTEVGGFVPTEHQSKGQVRKKKDKDIFQSFPFFQKSHFVKELARMFSTSVCQTVDDIFFARIKIKACS